MKKIILSSIAAAILATNSLAANYGTINGEEITDNDIMMVIRDPKVKFSTLPKATQKTILDQVVDTRLLAKNALKAGIAKDSKYKEALEKVKANLALEFWMQKQLKSIVIKDAELKKFYNDNKSKFTQSGKLKARHILLKKEDEAKKLIKILKSSKNLKTKFIELAKSKSTGPSGANGGDLGWFEAKQMVPEFSNAAKKLKKGTITLKPVKTQFGFHIIYLEDKKAEGIEKFDDVKKKIEQTISQEKFLKNIKKTVKSLRQKAKIKLNK